MREVFNDGKSAAQHLKANKVKLAAVGSKMAARTQHKLKGKLQSLRVTRDRMSSQQAQMDLDSYWGKQSKKYSPADVRDPKPATRLPTPIARSQVAPVRSHHEQYHYANKRNAYTDNRAAGASPWEYSWRRPSGASGQHLEKFQTQVQTAKSQRTTKQVMHQQLRQTAGKSHRHIARDLPPMPGSLEALEKQV